ncbi:hypothetical protein OESDEN_04980 [Oesophagostomum dentatum]|uniref:Uncharacterized protein n=1 Tax=Oesophagostomum dentatum TaxID=61180 RepID=A0A0B1TCS6_OESDE|nr:hypothetical protein OESDEN_04980 [Oesophagostomum dentatum]
MIRDSSERLSEKIIDQIVDILVVDPFESYMFDLVQSVPEQRVMESEQCSRLSEKAKRARSLEPDESHLKLVVSVLAELGGGSLDIDRLMTLSETQIDKQALVSDHLDITSLAAKESINSKKALFRFDATAFASGISTTDPTMQAFCPFFVMELFVERVKAGLADRIENALRGTDNTRPRNSLNSKVLPSCERILELCQEVYGLIVSDTTKSLSEVDGVASRRKISAA